MTLRISHLSDARQVAQAVNAALRRTDALDANALINANDDAAAATAGVPVNGYYRNGSVLMIRVA